MLLAQMVILAVTAATPIEDVDFQKGIYARVILKSSDVLTGIIESSANPDKVVLRPAGRSGRIVIEKSRIRKIILPKTLQQAHDKLAKTFVDMGNVGDETWYKLAVACMRKRPPLVKSAIDDLKISLRKNPKNTKSRAMLIDILLSTNALSQAESTLRNAPSETAKDITLLMASARIEKAMGRDPRPVLRIAQKAGGNLNVNLELARQEAQYGNHDEAFTLLEDAKKAHPQAGEAIIAEARINLTIGKYLEAEQIYRALIESARKFPELKTDAVIGLASSLYMQNKDAEISEIINMAPRTDARVLYLKGLLAIKKELSSRAQTKLTSTAKLGHPEANAALATMLYRDVWDSKLALNQLLEADTTTKASAYFYWLLGHLSEKTIDSKRAINAYTELVSLEPMFAPGWMALASVQHREELTEELNRTIARATKILPEHPDILTLRANLALGDENYSEAKELFQKAYRYGGKSSMLFNGLGFSANRDKMLMRASEYFVLAYTRAVLEGSIEGAKYALDSLSKIEELSKTKTTIYSLAADAPASPKTKMAKGVASYFNSGRTVISAKRPPPYSPNILSTNAPSDSLSSFSIQINLDGCLGYDRIALLMMSKVFEVELAITPKGQLKVDASDVTVTGKGKAKKREKKSTFSKSMDYYGQGPITLAVNLYTIDEDTKEIELTAQPTYDEDAEKFTVTLPLPETDKNVQNLIFALKTSAHETAKLLKVEIDNMVLVRNMSRKSSLLSDIKAKLKGDKKTKDSKDKKESKDSKKDKKTDDKKSNNDTDDTSALEELFSDY